MDGVANQAVRYLCGESPFWDSNLTWNSSYPQFTDCFQKTALMGAPCALLWMMSPFYGYFLLTSRDDFLPRSRLSSFKTMASTLLAMLTLSELSLHGMGHGSLLTDMASQLTFPAEVFSPLVLLFTVILTLAMMRLEQQKGLKSSAVLFLFWLLLTMGQIVLFCSVLFDEEHMVQPGSIWLFYGKFTVIVTLLVLNCMAETPDLDLPPEARRPCPEPDQPLWSRLTFTWVKELLVKGKKGDLTEKDIYELLPGERSQNLMPKFTRHWDREKEKARLRNHTQGPAKEKEEDPEELLDRLLSEERARRKRLKLMHKRTKSVEMVKKRVTFNRSQSEMHHPNHPDSLLAPDTVADTEKKAEEEGEKGEKQESKTSSKARPSFLMAMARSFAPDFILKQVCFMIRTSFDVADPLIFGLLLKFLEDPTAPAWRGYMICMLMVTSKILQTFMFVRTNFINHTFAIRIKSAIVNSVFKKALTMDTESRQESTVGQAVNLISVDAGDICHAFTWMASEMISVPFRIIVTLFMLYKLLGPSIMISVVMMAVMVPLNGLVIRKLSHMHKQLMEQKDERLKMLTEVINGVKILKMYAWEPSFIQKVNDARQEELDVMGWASFFDAANHFYWTVLPYVVSVTTFLAYVYNHEDHYLSPSVAFVALSLLDMLRGSLGVVPHIISHCVKVTVSFKRVNDFLARNDLEDDVTSDEDEAISVKSGFFSWKTGAAPTLKNINLSVKKGALVAVVGTVGCGKSSLLSACLGEMKKLKGRVSVKGSVAYVPQQAWIQHATLKENVLFGQELDEKLYQQCLDDCALRPDLDVLPGGDMTEIGEKGINLSGGQKQRVSLARAAYSQADIYMLDDPLSAVDCHVGSQLFDKILGHDGMLAGKTRVLVTHGVQWLPKVDQIIVVRHGRVTETGSYDELLTHNGAFAKFLKSYLVHNASGDSDPMMEKMKAELLHRLESIPDSVKCDHSNSQNNEGDSQVSSTDSSSSDNESIIQEMLKSVGLESAKQEQDPEDDVAAKEEEEAEKMRKKEKEDAKKSDGSLVEDEEHQVKEVNWNTLKDYAYMIGIGWVMLLLTLFTVQQLAERAGDLSLTQWTDNPELNNLTALPAESSERQFLNNYYLMVYAGFGVMHAITTMMFKIIMLLRKVASARILHNKMLSRVLQAPMTFFDTTPVGRIVTRFSSDLSTVDNNLIHTLEWALYLLFSVVARFGIICYTTPSFIFTVVPMVLIFSYVQSYFSPTMRILERLQSKTKAPIFSYFSETLNGTAVIRAFGAQKRFIKEFQRRFDLFQSVEFSWGNSNKWLHVRMQSCSAVVTAGVVLSAIAYRDVLSAGMVGLALSQAMDITGALHGIVHMVSWLQTQLISVDRVNDYCTMKQEAEWRNEETKPAASWPQKGQVKAVDLALRYREGLDLVLKGINVSFGAGEKVGIVGRTGAGKSSLTLALFRLVEPAGGEFMIDDVSITSLGLHDLRSRLTILPQDPVIFAGSLRMNLDPFSRFADEKLWEALKHAHLSNFVSGLKDGLKHECGEGGENLSVGQRQLLCLARTLLHKTQVLVLDEATAAVDMETDDLIQKTIRTEFKECTVLTIAHRLNTVIDYDKILVLDKGQVKEFDSPNNLMDNPDSVFHDMCKKAGLLKKKT